MNASVQREREAELIAAILAGETQLYHELIRPYERAVYVIALSSMKNQAEAEEVAQEAFFSAFRSLGTFRGASRFSTWLISIALNEAKARLRRQASLRMVSLDDSATKEIPAFPALLRDWREIPSEAVERKEIRALLQRAVERLPEIYRDVFLLRDMEELSVSETAQLLNISISLVKVRSHRARMMLQRQLAPRLKAMHSLQYS